MSDSDPTYISVLLPGARVAMFADDIQTVEAFKSLQTDWRFARVQLAHHSGGVDQTIAVMQAGGSVPDLLIIETNTIDEGFIGRLETLAEYCPEGTAAIVIGPVNDVNLYRKLIGMGISDYLVRPVNAQTLATDIGRTLIERMGASDSRLVAVIGAKGGVGATMLAEALSWGAAEILKQKVVLIDAAGGWSTVSVGMDFEPATTLAEAVRAATSGNEDAFKRMFHHAHDRLDVLSSGGDVMLEKTVDAAGYEVLVDRLMTTYPVVVVDLSHAPVDIARLMLSRAHEIMLVTTPMLPSLRAARTLMQEIKTIRSDSESCVDLIVNMVGLAPKQEVAKGDLETALDKKPSLHLSFSPGLFAAAESEGRKLTAQDEGAAITRNLLGVMAKILDPAAVDNIKGGEEEGRKGMLGGLIGKLGQK